MSLGQLLLDGKALPGTSRPTKAERPDRWVAKDARTDRAMTRILLQMTELLSQYRTWRRAERALNDKLGDPRLDDHPQRPAAFARWETASDRCAAIELGLWDLAPAAAAAWCSYSPAHREEMSRLGRWPPAGATVEEATGWFRDEWLFLAWRGVFQQ